MIKSILVNRKTDEAFKSHLKMEQMDVFAEMQAIENLPTYERLQLARLRRAQQLKVAHQKEKEWQKLQRAKGVSSTVLNGFTVDTQHHFRNNQQYTNSTNFHHKRHISFENSVVLLEAASRNDVQEVAELLKRGISPDASNEDGLTALHQCCIDNNLDMLKLLLDFGANVNAQDSDKWTPLHAAATCGHYELVRILINYGANLLAVNSDGNMPYDLCDDENTLDYIEAEMSKRGVTQELIDETRSATERKMLHDLIEHSKNGGDLNQPDEHGATPLHIAAANGYIKVVEFLLEMHVNVDAVDKDKWSPVHAAACWGHLEALEMLAKHGADLNIKNKDDETPTDICEDPEIRDRIEQLKNEQENKRLAEAQRRRVRRSQSNNTRAQSVRRTSLRDKNLTTKKDAVEETRLRLQAQDIFSNTSTQHRNAEDTNILDTGATLENPNPSEIHNRIGNDMVDSCHHSNSHKQKRLPDELNTTSESKSTSTKFVDYKLTNSMNKGGSAVTSSSPTNETSKTHSNISQESTTRSKINVQVTLLVDASSIQGHHHHHHSIQMTEQNLQPNKQRTSPNSTKAPPIHEVQKQQQLLVNATTLANLKKQRSLTRTTMFWKNYSNDSLLDSDNTNIIGCNNIDTANNNLLIAHKTEHNSNNKTVLQTKDQLEEQQIKTNHDIVYTDDYAGKVNEDYNESIYKQRQSMLELNLNKFSGRTGDIVSDNANSRKCCTVM